ncbi:uncharacterized protein BP5553_05355 [Venustampulla echinocandica]|uniref:Uncharacterized protein n=1 Tax=Venustampulla echinocandica TaxID=2656787 RepID=A0A370TQX8_9HELO|nr:uncharacterized protein BP5553_05355 [Venustampulla echinocandica]RDL37922.1 hypothetical protein BP5553_05355 [Venustampulla echinocandica]
MRTRTAQAVVPIALAARQVKLSSPKQRLPNKTHDVEYKAAAKTQRQAREPMKSNYVDRVPKTRPTISAAGVLKKKKNSDTTRGKKSHRRRKGSPESDLFISYKDGIETARDAILSNTEATFDSVHKGFMEQLSKSKAGDEAILSEVSATLAILSAPVAEEQIEIVTRQGSKRVTEIVKIGNRIAHFKDVVEAEEAKLAEYWKQWDELQNEYLELGVEVFGAKPFGEDAKEVVGNGIGKGYRKEMELLDLKLKTQAEEWEEKVQELRVKTLQKMKASEKEQDALTKKEQAKLLQALLQE